MSPQRFRKKPVVVEAVQWDGTPEGATPIIDWMLSEDGTARYHHGDDHARPFIAIDTLEGQTAAGPGDYVIRGVQGEFYPCKPDIFEATYEPAEVTP
jgi:hypothetical protein